MRQYYAGGVRYRAGAGDCGTVRGYPLHRRGPPLAPLSPALLLPFTTSARPHAFHRPRAELAQVAEHLADPACRLLTVIGPGGMGKTRLAIQAARRQTDVFAHGVWFVDLAPVSVADSGSRHRTGAAHIRIGADAQTQLLPSCAKNIYCSCWTTSSISWKAPVCWRICWPAHQRSNCWSLPAPAEPARGVAGAVGRAGDAGGLRITKARRSRTSGADEVHEARSGLSEPSRFVGFVSLRDFALQPATLEHYSATALFLACVRRLRPDFRPSDEDARQIVRICRLLDGMPLAIEMAAAWIARCR